MLIWLPSLHLLQDNQQVKWEIVEDDELLECRVPRFLSTLMIIHKLHSYELHESKFTTSFPIFCSAIYVNLITNFFIIVLFRQLIISKSQQVQTEMDVLDERIRLWSSGKEADIRLLLSSLHHVRRAVFLYGELIIM